MKKNYHYFFVKRRGKGEDRKKLKKMAVCVSKYPTLIDIEDIILTFERAIWRDQCEVVSEKVASERPKDAETIGSYVFLYKSTGLAGSWLSWPAW